MIVAVDIEVAPSGDRPPEGAPVIAEVRDTTAQDVSALTLGRATGTVAAGSGPLLTTLDLEYEPSGGDLTLWAHVDVDGDGAVSAGDWITMQSFAVRPSDRLRVEVRPVTPASPPPPG
jgi:hypothetical protein